MPVEIRELIIRVIVGSDAGSGKDEGAAYDTIQEAVEQTMDILEKAKER